MPCFLTDLWRDMNQICASHQPIGGGTSSRCSFAVAFSGSRRLNWSVIEVLRGVLFLMETTTMGWLPSLKWCRTHLQTIHNP